MSSFFAAIAVAVGAALLAGASPAAALEQGLTRDGWPYAAGGFGVDERAALGRMGGGRTSACA